MRVVTGTVVHGKVEVPADSIAEGERVMILAPEQGGPVLLSPEEEEDLFASLEEIRRVDFIDGQDLIDELRAARRS